MADTDLSKIVGLIMENPKLIEEIKKLGQEKEKKEDVKESVETMLKFKKLLRCRQAWKKMPVHQSAKTFYTH